MDEEMVERRGLKGRRGRCVNGYVMWSVSERRSARLGP